MSATEPAAERLGLYIHWPFCASKCPYCDFNVHVRNSIDHEAWQSAYVRALEHYAQLLPGRMISTVYFGGGTPSLMDPRSIEAILAAVQRTFRIANGLEVTLEANPTSAEQERFAAFRAAGINRLSLGVQALGDEDLKFLGRTHTRAQALQAIENAKAVFDRASFDLIYARPNQSLAEWEKELREAAMLAHGHLSLYQLTIERSTPFYFAHAQGKFSLPTQELAADFYTLTQDILEEQGYEGYEISNHARGEGNQSRHNRIYWEYSEYIGIGPGAHGRVRLPGGRKVATRDHYAPDLWLKNVQAHGHGAHPFDFLSPRDQFEEALMMGLRLKEGIDLKMLLSRTEIDLRTALDPQKIEHIRHQGWVEGSIIDRLALTREGRLRLNALLSYLLT